MNFYLESAKILKSLEEKKGTLKNLIYASQHANKKKLQAFMSGVVGMIQVLKELAEKGISDKIKNIKGKVGNENESGDGKVEGLFKNNYHLLIVSLFEFFFGASDQLPFNLKSAFHHRRLDPILSSIQAKWQATDNHHLFTIISQQQTSYHLPRYVRVNTIHKSTNDVINTLISDGWKLLSDDGNDDYHGHIERLSHLQGDVFIRDPHVPDLLIFPHGTSFHQEPLFLHGDVILQDKASCLAALALCPPAGSVVVDACAAPGNKTSYLAALMRNKGTIHAFDMDECRFSLMQTMLQKAGVCMVEGRNEDFLSVHPRSPPYNLVQYILVDPSCSGSGIVDRQDISHSESERPENHQKRIKSLSNFQAMMLNHALKFPKVQKVVYSTCSVHRQENEEVVMEALAKNRNFRLQTIFKNIPSRGINGEGGGGNNKNKNNKNVNTNNSNNNNDDDNDDGDDGDDDADMRRCVRLCPEDDLTNGFFIASFVRRATFGGKNNNNENKNNINANNHRNNNNNKGDVEHVSSRKRKKGRDNDCDMSGPVKNNKNNNNNNSNDNNIIMSSLNRQDNAGGADDDFYASNPLHELSRRSKKQLLDNNKDKVINKNNKNNIGKNNNSNNSNKTSEKRERKLLKKRRGREQGRPIVSL